jgi:DNA mismatch repair ATPase MutS
MYLVNLFIAIDPLIYVFLIKSIDDNLSTLRLCFRSLGELDAIIALGSYINRYPNHCNPILVQSKNLNLENTYHPLIDNYVVNSFKTSGKSALITGSNMAGKTTFIRTIGINIVLARTLWLCHADSALIPIVNVSSSISNTDFLEEGKSYYFTELEYIHKFILMTQNDEHHLFLIDEIFRGTNTVERIGGAAAVLQALAIKDLVLVTTHDVELERFLNERYEMWHFQETGKKEQPFDYKIHPGICRTKNAIKLMKNMGYPEHIVGRAKQIAGKMEERYQATIHNSKSV